MTKTLLAAMIILFWVLLIIHLVFTVLAIFGGGAPIPSLRSTVRKMIKLADIKPGEFLVDLGSGDGRVLIAAARRGATCVGYEINPLLIFLSRVKVWLQRVPGVTILAADLWKADLSTADVVTLYITPNFLPKLREKILREMKPGSRVISGVFAFPDWEPEVTDGKVYKYRLGGRA